MTFVDDLPLERTPDYWFVVLFRALRESDLSLAGEAQQQLAELGIDVRFSALLRDGMDVHDD